MAIILELLLREKECVWLQEHVLLFYHLSGYASCIFYFLCLTFPLLWMQVVNPASWSSFFYTFVSRVSQMWSLKGLSKTMKLAGIQALLLASRRRKRNLDTQTCLIIEEDSSHVLVCSLLAGNLWKIIYLLLLSS